MEKEIYKELAEARKWLKKAEDKEHENFWLGKISALEYVLTLIYKEQRKNA